MKREFLLGLQVGEQALPKEIIDAIMAENGKDIQKVRAGFADYETLKEELTKLQQTARENQTDRESARAWEEKYNQAVAEHRKQIGALTFQNCLDAAIARSKGRSEKAIRALLDLDALQESEDQPAAIEAALAELKKSSGYLFEHEGAPHYARLTGAWQGSGENSPTTLAGALKERFERK